MAYVCTVPGCFCARQLKDYSTCLEGEPASLPNSLPGFLCGVGEHGEVGTFACTCLDSQLMLIVADVQL